MESSLDSRNGETTNSALGRNLRFLCGGAASDFLRRRARLHCSFAGRHARPPCSLAGRRARSRAPPRSLALLACQLPRSSALLACQLPCSLALLARVRRRARPPTALLACAGRARVRRCSRLPCSLAGCCARSQVPSRWPTGCRVSSPVLRSCLLAAALDAALRPRPGSTTRHEHAALHGKVEAG